MRPQPGLSKSNQLHSYLLPIDDRRDNHRARPSEIGNNMATDEQVRRRVLHHLRAQMRLKGEVTVTVAAGEVVLGGWLASPAKRWAVAESVRRVAGVAVVRNDIELPTFSPDAYRAGDQAKDLVTSVVRPSPWAGATGTLAR
jgi:osmotically-inducible protein OsmY